MDSKIYHKMKYRIDKIPMTDQVIFKFPDLMQFANIFASEIGMPQNVTADFVMRYIMLMYSPGSPGIEIYPMLAKRKTWALKELGVNPLVDGSFPTEYNELLLNKNQACRAKVVLFLRLQQPEDWAIMMRAEEMLYPEDPTDQKNHISNIESLRKQLSESRERFMQGEISKALENEITKFLAQDNLGIRPEEYMMFAPKGTAPSKAKADQMFPEVGN
jgi:hypothetical protein